MAADRGCFRLRWLGELICGRESTTDNRMAMISALRTVVDQSETDLDVFEQFCGTFLHRLNIDAYRYPYGQEQELWNRVPAFQIEGNSLYAWTIRNSAFYPAWRWSLWLGQPLPLCTATAHTVRCVFGTPVPCRGLHGRFVHGMAMVTEGLFWYIYITAPRQNMWYETYLRQGIQPRLDRVSNDLLLVDVNKVKQIHGLPLNRTVHDMRADEDLMRPVMVMVIDRPCPSEL